MVPTPRGDQGCVRPSAAGCSVLDGEEAKEVGDDKNENDHADDVDDVALAHGWLLLVPHEVDNGDEDDDRPKQGKDVTPAHEWSLSGVCVEPSLPCRT